MKDYKRHFTSQVREKVYFGPGDRVRLKQEIPNKPVMVVSTVDKAVHKFDSKDSSSLLGVTCIWFSSDLKIQSHRFNTKDLEKLDDHD